MEEWKDIGLHPAPLNETIMVTIPGYMDVYAGYVEEMVKGYPETRIFRGCDPDGNSVDIYPIQKLGMWRLAPSTWAKRNDFQESAAEMFLKLGYREIDAIGKRCFEKGSIRIYISRETVYSDITYRLNTHMAKKSPRCIAVEEIPAIHQVIKEMEE